MEFTQVGHSGQQAFTSLQTCRPHIQIQLEDHSRCLRLTLFILQLP